MEQREQGIYTAKPEAAHFTCRQGHKNLLRQKLTANIHVGNALVIFNEEAT